MDLNRPVSHLSSLLRCHADSRGKHGARYPHSAWYIGFWQYKSPTMMQYIGKVNKHANGSLPVENGNLMEFSNTCFILSCSQITSASAWSGCTCGPWRCGTSARWLRFVSCDPSRCLKANGSPTGPNQLHSANMGKPPWSFILAASCCEPTFEYIWSIRRCHNQVSHLWSAFFFGGQAPPPAWLAALRMPSTTRAATASWAAIRRKWWWTAAKGRPRGAGTATGASAERFETNGRMRIQHDWDWNGHLLLLKQHIFFNRIQHGTLQRSSETHRTPPWSSFNVVKT